MTDLRVYRMRILTILEPNRPWVYGAWAADCSRCRWFQLATSQQDALRRAHRHCAERRAA